MNRGRIEINLLTLIFVCIIIATIITFGIKLFNNELTNESNSSGVEDNSSTAPPSFLESELVLQLHSYLFNHVNFHRNEKITLDSFGTREVIIAVCSSLEDGTRTVISTDEFNKRLYQIFGKEIIVLHESAYIDDTLGGYTFEDGQYVINTSRSDVIEHKFRKLINAEEIDDYIFLYDRYALYIADGSTESLYADSERNIRIARVSDTLTETPIIEYTNESSYNKNFNIDYLIAKYGDEIPTYKHTFKKDSSGVYHWVSSELIVSEEPE